MFEIKIGYDEVAARESELTGVLKDAIERFERGLFSDAVLIELNTGESYRALRYYLIARTNHVGMDMLVLADVTYNPLINNRMYDEFMRHFTYAKHRDALLSVIDGEAVSLRSSEVEDLSHWLAWYSILDRKLMLCDACGKPNRVNDMQQLSGGKRVCESCFDSMELRKCEYCANYYEGESESAFYDGDEIEVCGDCYEQSFYCYYHERQEIGDSYYVNGTGEYICDDALDSDEFCSCASCGEVFEASDLTECSDGECRCEECREDYYEDCGLNSYSYKPMPVFVKEDGSTTSDNDGDLYLGLELEVDNGNLAEFIESMIDVPHVYLKHDGSLSDEGAEIVTHPLHYSFAYRWDGWETIRSNAIGAGMRSHDADTCGLHVHLNGEYFGEKGLTRDYNVSKLVRIFEKFQDGLIRFSRRRPSQIDSWCRFSDSKIDGKESDGELKDKLDKVKWTRYNAVNLCNSSTVEIRLWRGTLNLNTLSVTIDFTQAVARFAKEKDHPDIERLHKFGDLLEALKPYAFDYDAMKEYADSRGCE